MNAIIVAAGIGRRLLPLTKNNPKCLLKINSKKIIDLTLEALEECQPKDIVLVVGYQQEKIRNYLGGRVKYVINPIYDKINSMYSLMYAQDYFGEEFVYLHSDIIFEKAILKQLISLKHEICLAVDEKITDKEDMKVRIEDGLIREINKYIPLDKAGGEFIGIAKFAGNGIMHLKRALYELTRDKKNYNAYFEYAVEFLIRQGNKVYPSLTKNKFYAEIDTRNDLEKIRNIFHKGHF